MLYAINETVVDGVPRITLTPVTFPDGQPQRQFDTVKHTAAGAGGGGAAAKPVVLKVAVVADATAGKVLNVLYPDGTDITDVHVQQMKFFTDDFKNQVTSDVAARLRNTAARLPGDGTLNLVLSRLVTEKVKAIEVREARAQEGKDGWPAP